MEHLVAGIPGEHYIIHPVVDEDGVLLVETHYVHRHGLGSGREHVSDLSVVQFEDVHPFPVRPVFLWNDALTVGTQPGFQKNWICAAGIVRHRGVVGVYGHVGTFLNACFRASGDFPRAAGHCVVVIEHTRTLVPDRISYDVRQRGAFPVDALRRSESFGRRQCRGY